MDTVLTHFAALRRQARLPARIPVRIKMRGMSLDTVTMDVSMSGAFVLCDVLDVTVDEEIKVRFWLPDSLDYVTLSGRVARIGNHDGARGCGVMFEHHTTGGALDAWEGFVDRMMQHSPPSGSWSIPKHVEHTWYGLTLEALEALSNVDVFIGGIFVNTRVVCDMDMRVRLMLVHPVDGSRLSVNTKVTGRRHQGECGLCLEFCEPAQALSARIRTFIEQGMPTIEFNDVLMKRATRELLRVG